RNRLLGNICGGFYLPGPVIDVGQSMLDDLCRCGLRLPPHDPALPADVVDEFRKKDLTVGCGDGLERLQTGVRMAGDCARFVLESTHRLALSCHPVITDNLVTSQYSLCT